MYDFLKFKLYSFLAGILNVQYRNSSIARPDNRNRINLKTFNQRLNFGDALSGVIVKVLSGQKVTVSSTTDTKRDFKPTLMALGSILDCAKDGDIVWGTGINSRSLEIRDLDVRAVRGPLTRDQLNGYGIRCPEIYGDPAVLLPYLYKPDVKKKYDVGILLHFNDFTRINYRGSKRIKMIDIRDSPIKVIKDICRSRVILSSALHGIITSESYGVPACWLRSDASLWLNGSQEYETKYRDYYLSTGRAAEPYYFDKSFDVEEAVKRAVNMPLPEIDPEPLLLSFPFLRSDIRKLDDLKRYEIRDFRCGLSVLYQYERIRFEIRKLNHFKKLQGSPIV